MQKITKIIKNTLFLSFCFIFSSCWWGGKENVVNYKPASYKEEIIKIEQLQSRVSAYATVGKLANKEQKQNGIIFIDKAFGLILEQVGEPQKEDVNGVLKIYEAYVNNNLEKAESLLERETKKNKDLQKQIIELRVFNSKLSSEHDKYKLEAEKERAARINEGKDNAYNVCYALAFIFAIVGFLRMNLSGLSLGGIGAVKSFFSKESLGNFGLAIFFISAPWLFEAVFDSIQMQLILWVATGIGVVCMIANYLKSRKKEKWLKRKEEILVNMLAYKDAFLIIFPSMASIMGSFFQKIKDFITPEEEKKIREQVGFSNRVTTFVEEIKSIENSSNGLK